MGWGFQPGDPFEGTDLTSVLIGKDLILSGWWSKIEVIQVLGIYIYVIILAGWCLPANPMYRIDGPGQSLWTPFSGLYPRDAG